MRDTASGTEGDAPRESESVAREPVARETMTLPTHVQRQIDLLTSLRSESERSLGRHQRAVESLTARIGQPRTLYALVMVVAVWAGTNAWMLARHGTAFDPPPFAWLQGGVSLYAALVGTVVLITQNRQAKHEEHRSYLELQVNLLAEQKAGKIISLLEELRRDLPSVRNRVDKEAETMARAVNPRAVLSAFEEQFEDAATAAKDPPNGTGEG